jgi:hypothetical protein
MLAMIKTVARLALCATIGAYSQTVDRIPAPVDPIQGIVTAFQRRPIVIIGENHWLRQAGDFYIRLVRDPAFQNTVQDIVVEFASRNNQPLLDRYIAGEDVPMTEVRRIWRDTTKVASWESPIYAEWLAAIRAVNRDLPQPRRLRVLAGDTAVDWSRIQTHADWAALGDNNISFADVVVRQVLQKKHRALVVLGANHVIKSGDRTGSDNTTTRIEKQFPDSTYVLLLLYAGVLDRSKEDSLGLSIRDRPALYELSGTQLSKTTDGLLYIAPREAFTQALPPAGSLDAAYLKEVDRRSMIEWGELRARRFLGAAAQ